MRDYRGFLVQHHAGIAPEIYRYWRTRVARRHRLWAALESELSDANPGSAGPPRFPPPLRIPWEFLFTFQWAVASMRGRYACAFAEDVGTRFTPAAARAA